MLLEGRRHDFRNLLPEPWAGRLQKSALTSGLKYPQIPESQESQEIPGNPWISQESARSQESQEIPGILEIWTLETPDLDSWRPQIWTPETPDLDPWRPQIWTPGEPPGRPSEAPHRLQI